VLLAGRHEEKDLGQRGGVDARTLEESAHGESQNGPIGLRRPFDPVTLGLEPALETPELGRLARPLDAFERDERSAHVKTPATRKTTSL
jgi:hypothetical protein